MPNGAGELLEAFEGCVSLEMQREALVVDEFRRRWPEWRRRGEGRSFAPPGRERVRGVMADAATTAGLTHLGGVDRGHRLVDRKIFSEHGGMNCQDR